MSRPELARLMAVTECVDRVFTEGDPLEEYDVFSPLLELPGAFGTDLTSVPACESYLTVPSQVVADRKLTKTKEKKVGLIWAGNPNHPNDRNRSCPLAEFLHLLPTENVVFYSLQVGEASQQILSVPELQVVNIAAALDDYAETAANVCALDAVVTVDTSVAHLAGALGRPVALLLPYSPDWRWLLDRDDSPWYPSMSLFRQKAPGDWSSVWPNIRDWLGSATAGFSLRNK